MGILSSLRKGAQAAIAFNQTLDECGINYRIFPAQFQSELYSLVREAARGNSERERQLLIAAARVTASVMSPSVAQSTGIFTHPAQRESGIRFARIIVPLLERHGIAHHFDEEKLSGA